MYSLIRSAGILCLWVLGLGAPILPTQAFVMEADNNVLVTEVTNDSLFAAGSNIQLNSIITGDAIVFWNNVSVWGDVYEDLWIAASTVVIDGEVQDDLRVAASELAINSTVTGDVIALVWTLTLGQWASIGGNLTVSSEVETTAELEALVWGTVTVLDTDMGWSDTQEYTRQWFNWFGLISKIIIAWLIIALLGRFLAPIAATALSRLPASIGAGIAYFVWMPIIGLLLLITGVLAPIAGLVIVDYLFAWIFLSVIVAICSAAWLVREKFTDNAQLQTRWGTTLVAWVLLALLQLLPYFVTVVLWIIMIGAMILYLRSMWKYLRSE